MSRITDYQQQLRRNEADRELQSVADFAFELKKSPESLLAQLREAGVPKANSLDSLTLADKNKLLNYLQNSKHAKTPRKRIALTLESHEQKLIRSVAKQENGAEFEALRGFANDVIWGHSIDPMHQKMVNLIVAKAVLIGALPLEKLGRPKHDELDSVGLNAAHRYWDMIDSGLRYQEAVERLSEEFHKSERHIMRLISKHKKAVGETLEDRCRNRQWNRLLFETYSRRGIERFEPMNEPSLPAPNLNLDDYLEHLDEMTQKLAASFKPLTKKI